MSLPAKPAISSRSGLTLLEILITLALVAILTVGVAGLYGNYIKAVQLDLAAKALTSDLKDARSRSMAGEDDLKWGVYIVSSVTSSYYQVFSTTGTYSGASTTIPTYLSSGISFSTPAAGTTSTVLFSKLNGTTTSTSLVLFSPSLSSTRAISISTSGTVY